MSNISIVPFKRGFILCQGNNPIRTPNKNGVLVWRTYKTREEAEAIVLELKGER